MAKRKAAAPNDDAAAGGAAQEAPDDSVYIGQERQARISFCSGSPTGTG